MSTEVILFETVDLLIKHLRERNESRFEGFVNIVKQKIFLQRILFVEKNNAFKEKKIAHS